MFEDRVGNYIVDACIRLWNRLRGAGVDTIIECIGSRRFCFERINIDTDQIRRHPYAFEQYIGQDAVTAA